ncbi:TniB family NTP-binding protein [Microbulbifer epialgicus]|uniref:TniB family NTP-binding protein n=1 Tax=Microbulbifer epialgicus TaxID=393907 RepID=A0ABV4NYI3_9GAMM
MEKIEYFKSGFFMKHDAVNCAYEHLQELFFDSSEKDVVLVQGPTGFGKTCLSEYLMREAYKNVDVMNEQVNELPMIYVEADVLGGSKFSWKDFYSELLNAMGELQNIKIYGHPKIEGSNIGRKYLSQNRNEISLKRDFLSRVRDYGVKYIIVDEVQHIFKYGGQSGEKNMNILKGISNRSGCRFVGLGTYEISFSLDMSDQLARRVGIMDYPAYSIRRPGDVAKFSSAYSGLLAYMPIMMEPSLIKNAKAVFMGSCGCIGILKEWLGRALNMALKDKDKVLTVKHLDKTRLKNNQIKTIAEAIREGEAFFRQPGDDEIWDILGGKPEKKRNNKPSSSRGKNPGQRSPTRDKVG